MGEPPIPHLRWGQERPSIVGLAKLTLALDLSPLPSTFLRGSRAASDSKFQAFWRGWVSRGLCEAFLFDMYEKCAEFRRLSEPKRRPHCLPRGEISSERADGSRGERLGRVPFLLPIGGDSPLLGTKGSSPLPKALYVMY
jgi:hypothetical protein